MRRLLALVGVLFVGLSSCYVGYDPYYYDYAYYDPYYYYGYDGYWVYTWVDPYGVYYYSQTPSDPAGANAQQAVDVNAAAAAIAARAGSFFTPAGCVTATATGATVSYTLDHCDGQFGLQSMSGSLTLVVTDNGGQLEFHGASNNLTVNGSSYVFDVSATATRSGAERSVTFTSDSHAPDIVQSRRDQGTITWEQGTVCVNASGSGTSSRGNMTTALTVSSYHRCQSTCPTSGTVSEQSKDGVFTGKFDGTSTFVVVAPNGNKKSYKLQCSQ